MKGCWKTWRSKRSATRRRMAATRSAAAAAVSCSPVPTLAPVIARSPLARHDRRRRVPDRGAPHGAVPLVRRALLALALGPPGAGVSIASGAAAHQRRGPRWRRCGTDDEHGRYVVILRMAAPASMPRSRGAWAARAWGTRGILVARQGGDQEVGGG